MPTLNVSDETLAAIRESLVAEMERVKQDATRQVESYERTLAEISENPKAGTRAYAPRICRTRKLAEISENPKAGTGQVKRRRGRPKKDVVTSDTGAADSRLAPAGGSVIND